MIESHVYMIFWGPSNGFALSYAGPIMQWATDLQSDHARTTNEFSVVRQYADAAGRKISDRVSLDGLFFDTTPFPPLDTAAGCDAAHAPCVSDAQMRAEIVNDLVANGWPMDKADDPRAQYMLFTPSGTSMCEGAGGSCTFSSTGGFCGYHSIMTGLKDNGSSGGNKVVVYDTEPYLAGCDSGQAPSGVQGNPDTDGTLDTAIHELAESATDPSPGTGYTDSTGAEIGDKCTGPIVNTQPTIYGTPLGGDLAGNTAFNQLIGGNAYYTQMLWSNAPTATPASTAAAGCVQRTGPSPSFEPPAGTLQAGVPLSFDGSGSTEVDLPITSYRWSWGDGSPDTLGATATHVYGNPGTYTVTLTVADVSGARNGSTETRVITVTPSS
jgi:hypothetical protein